MAIEPASVVAAFPTPDRATAATMSGDPTDMSQGRSTSQETMLWLTRGVKAIVVVVYAFVLVDLVLLILGLLPRLLGASTEADFTRWVCRSVELRRPQRIDPSASRFVPGDGPSGR